MNSVRSARLLLVFLLAALSGVARCAPQPAASANLSSSAQAPGTLDLSLTHEARAAIARGLQWLAAQQAADGSWSNNRFPALTALAVQALLRSGDPSYAEQIDAGVAYILTCVREDGGIYCDVPDRKGGGLSNYNTAICMTALHALDRPSLVPVVQNARTFIARSQHFGDDVYTGGFGYDRETKRAYTDLLNTYYAVEGMRRTQDVEDSRPASEARADINWAETVRFIERLQNRPETGPENAGGFFYNPTDPKAGTTTNREGVVIFRSYGSITYAGMLALLYADVSRDDVRVRSAFDWACRHWGLDENPGMGQQGLYFFYNVLSTCLAAYGQDMIPVADQPLVDWKAALTTRLIERQRIDPDTGGGYWVNENGRYWENDPVLVTAYALLALE